MNLPSMLWPMTGWQKHNREICHSFSDYNVFNVNLVEFPIESLLQVLGGCHELQVSHIKGCCSSPLPSSVEVDCIRHLVKSIRASCASSRTFLGAFGTMHLPFIWLADLGFRNFRSDYTGIGDSVDALILGLASISHGVPNNSALSALMNVSICLLLDIARQTLA